METPKVEQPKIETQTDQQSQQALNTAFFAPVAERFIKASGLSQKHFEKEVSFVLQLVHSNKRLSQCSNESLMKAILNVANIGLTLNPVSKYAYLVPRYNSIKKCLEAALDPSYVGLVKLLTDAGSVKSVTATLIYDNDSFEVIYGMYPNIIHKPTFTNRGKIKGVYAIATLADGEKQFEVMTAEEIYEIRERSETFKAFKENKISSCTWITDEGEMFRKTVIKRIYKYLPKTEKSNFVEEAIEIDNDDFKANVNTIMYIDDLMRNSTMTDERISSLQLEMNPGLTSKRAGEIIMILQQNQKPTLTDQYKAKMIEVENITKTQE